MAVKIYPHRSYSASARALAQATGYGRLRHENSTWVPREGDTVINWGSSSCPNFAPARRLNPPYSVGTAANKRAFFQFLNTSRQQRFFNTEVLKFPAFTTSMQEAIDWSNNGVILCARRLLTGHSGQGLELLRPGDRVINAPLYTQYIPKRDEYRVHLIRREDMPVNPMLVTRKARNTAVPDDDVNWQVRTHRNGFVYVTPQLPTAEIERLRRIANETLGALSLDFGAVDIIYNSRSDTYYVLEVNTAPGLEGRTIDFYANGFRFE